MESALAGTVATPLTKGTDAGGGAVSEAPWLLVFRVMARLPVYVVSTMPNWFWAWTVRPNEAPAATLEGGWAETTSLVAGAGLTVMVPVTAGGSVPNEAWSVKEPT